MAGRPIHCSFCGKRHDQVPHMVLGANGAICSRCVDDAATLIEAMREAGPYSRIFEPPMVKGLPCHS